MKVHDLPVTDIIFQLTHHHLYDALISADVYDQWMESLMANRWPLLRILCVMFNQSVWHTRNIVSNMYNDNKHCLHHRAADTEQPISVFFVFLPEKLVTFGRYLLSVLTNCLTTVTQHTWYVWKRDQWMTISCSTSHILHSHLWSVAFTAGAQKTTTQLRNVLKPADTRTQLKFHNIRKQKKKRLALTCHTVEYVSVSLSVTASYPTVSNLETNKQSVEMYLNQCLGFREAYLYICRELNKHT